MITKAEFSAYIKEFRLKELFLDLGWDNDRTSISPIEIGGEALDLRMVAQKSGFRVIECEASSIPPYAIRIKAANSVKKMYHEHLLIFYNAGKTEQVWLYCYNQNSQNKKADIRYSIDQDVERLYQRASGLIFELDEQDSNTIIDVVARVRGNFAVNAEKVTKRFYDAFKKQHTALLGFIEGIQSQVDKEWYASIMLNRLMFCYFMQRRGFLDNDRNYLRNRLNESKDKLGKGKFYSFYRSFLLVLFQQGFGHHAHPPKIREMIGEIPYLNGGLFDLHEIENVYSDIDISDEAFERIFDLFDSYEWHLDTRDCATGNEISPDVLGYIFEKYINDRSSMGAYYTQEDITGYISRSTILPWLLESVKKTYPKAFEEDGLVWSFLKDSEDTYIFDSVKHGVDIPLPDYIAVGLDTTSPGLLERRSRWNEPATSDYALPTEIWRETVERRSRCENVRGLISNRKITDVADFITYNLDIVSFVSDLIDTIEDPKFIQVFYTSLEKITILDPTCGSGAFLFAALNILEPLYNSCLSRMDDYLRHDYKGIMERGVRRSFDEKLELMEESIHPSKQYFIYKSIILNNLYGVDIMREAVETAKLRLFLKLVSTVDPDYSDPNLGIEPLPDIDFNIKAGNTLIGYANEAEVHDALHHDLYARDMIEETMDAMLQMSKATSRFKQMQLGFGDRDADDFRKSKNDLSTRQAKLRTVLDDLLRKWDYDSVSDEDWAANYMPFHWVSEFYEIIVGNGGFDVIIGNPPYVEYSKIKKVYVIQGYTTESCGNLYAFVIERASTLSGSCSRTGMIVQLPIVCTDRMIPLQEIYSAKSKNLWYATFDDRPGRLFDGLEHIRATIVLNEVGNVLQCRAATTKYNRWYSDARIFLFDNICFSTTTTWKYEGAIPKVSVPIDETITEKLYRKASLERSFGQGIPIFFHNAPQYWIRSMTHPPYFWNERGGEQLSVQVKRIAFNGVREAKAACATINSSLFYWWFVVLSDCRHLNLREITRFRLGLSEMADEVYEHLCYIVDSLMDDYSENAQRKHCVYKTTGKVVYDEFYPKLSKLIIDKIDNVLAKHYGFTEEELDYIINYDIKYRMGISGGGGDDE